jgi:nitrous oxidase accessory protein
LIFLLVFAFLNSFIIISKCQETSSDNDISNTDLIIYVDENYNDTIEGWGVSRFNVIQDAIDTVNNSGVIYVNNGTYNGNIVINKTVSLIGSDKNYTIIEGKRSLYAILIKCSNVNISSFTIQNSKAGIYISGSEYNSCNISGNIIMNGYEGIHFYKSSNNSIYNNALKNHTAAGIVLIESSNNLITNNRLVDNAKCIYLSRWSNNNALLVNNLTDYIYGIRLDWSLNNLVLNNYVIEGEDGISFYFSNNNTVTENVIENNYGYGIYLSNSENIIISSNNFANNRLDIKEKSSPKKSKIPVFEIFLIIFVMILILFIIVKIKYFR